MPPTRKARTTSSGHGPAARGSQKTLSFGRRFGSQVSKPSTPAAAKELSSSGAVASASPLGKSVVVALAAPPSPSTAAQDVDVEEQQLLPQGGLVKASEEEARAQKVTDAQVQRYWRAREGERLTRRVHQEGLGVEEKILRWWDVSSQFGPAIGIARKKRWARAHRLRLNPPIEVLAVLLREEARGNTDIERAHVDELMSSKFVVGGDTASM